MFKGLLSQKYLIFTLDQSGVKNKSQYVAAEDFTGTYGQHEVRNSPFKMIYICQYKRNDKGI